jgi:nucleoside-diphosphate-sugar epimerase
MKDQYVFRFVLVKTLKVLQKNLEGSLVTSINFGPNSEGLSVRRVAELACEYWPQKTSISFAPELTKYETNKLNLNSNFAKEFLNWRPVFSQEESIKHTINWWKRSHLNHELAEFICRDQVKNFLDQKVN